MPVIQARTSYKALPAPARRVLYVGPAADEVCAIVTRHVGEIDIRYESDVQQALALARETKPDTVIVDQRDERLATKLIVPLFSNMGYPLRLVVVSPLNDVSQYLSVPGVARVLTAPIREGQLLRVIGLPYRPPRAQRASAAPLRLVEPEGREPDLTIESLPQPPVRLKISASALDKTRVGALLMLVTLCALAVYGALSSYFMFSTAWGVPMSLSQGHEMVKQVEDDLAQMRASLGRTNQALSDTATAQAKASRDIQSADERIKTFIGAIDKEIAAGERKRKAVVTKLKRTAKVHDVLQAQAAKGGMDAKLQELVKGRLIDQQTFDAVTQDPAAASKRAAKLEADMVGLKTQVAGFEARTELLASLKTALEQGGPITVPAAVPSDLLPLFEQAKDATAARATAAAALKTAQDDEKPLKDAAAVLNQQISALDSSALAKAITGQADVIFVPYANMAKFQPGTPLNSCALTLVWCTQVGFVGDPQPGEFTAAHPLSGKPLRGIFVEARLTKPVATTRSVIIGNGPPFLF